MNWFEWAVDIVIDNVPWWAWLAAVIAGLAVTASLWMPLYVAAPGWLKIILWVVGVGGIAYVAGRNRGASGALQRAREKEQARADDIREKADEARSNSDHDAVSGRLRDDDGWRRDDG